MSIDQRFPNPNLPPLPHPTRGRILQDVDPGQKSSSKLTKLRNFFSQKTGYYTQEKGVRVSRGKSILHKVIEYKADDNRVYYINRSSALKFLERNGQLKDVEVEKMDPDKICNLLTKFYNDEIVKKDNRPHQAADKILYVSATREKPGGRPGEQVEPASPLPEKLQREPEQTRNQSKQEAAVQKQPSAKTEAEMRKEMQAGMFAGQKSWSAAPESPGIPPQNVTTEQPVEEIIQQPVEEIIQQPVEEIVQQPVEEIVQQPVEEIIQQPEPQPTVTEEQPPASTGVEQPPASTGHKNPTESTEDSIEKALESTGLQVQQEIAESDASPPQQPTSSNESLVFTPPKSSYAEAALTQPKSSPEALNLQPNMPAVDRQKQALKITEKQGRQDSPDRTGEQKQQKPQATKPPTSEDGWTEVRRNKREKTLTKPPISEAAKQSDTSKEKDEPVLRKSQIKRARKRKELARQKKLLEQSLTSALVPASTELTLGAAVSNPEDREKIITMVKILDDLLLKDADKDFPNTEAGKKLNDLVKLLPENKPEIEESTGQQREVRQTADNLSEQEKFLNKFIEEIRNPERLKYINQPILRELFSKSNIWVPFLMEKPLKEVENLEKSLNLGKTITDTSEDTETELSSSLPEEPTLTVHSPNVTVEDNKPEVKHMFSKCSKGDLIPGVSKPLGLRKLILLLMIGGVGFKPEGIKLHSNVDDYNSKAENDTFAGPSPGPGGEICLPVYTNLTLTNLTETPVNISVTTVRKRLGFQKKLIKRPYRRQRRVKLIYQLKNVK